MISRADDNTGIRDRAARKTHYACIRIRPAILLDLLLLLDSQPGIKSSDVAHQIGLSMSALYRLLSAAERDLHVVVHGRRATGGLRLQSWGVLDAEAVRNLVRPLRLSQPQEDFSRR